LFNLGIGTQVSNMYEVRSAILEADNKRDTVRSRLMREYTRARIDGDEAAMVDTRRMIDAFNSRNPREVRITYSNLGASYKQERNRTKETTQGIRVDKTNKDIAQTFGIGR
jgi:hypothetical protein